MIALFGIHVSIAITEDVSLQSTVNHEIDSPFSNSVLGIHVIMAPMIGLVTILGSNQTKLSLEMSRYHGDSGCGYKNLMPYNRVRYMTH